MQILGLVGWSGSGKTTLLTALIPIFKARGLTVSTVKHAHHDLTFDRPGKDSFRHAQAGAQEVVLAADGGFALFSSVREMDLAALVARLAPVDLVLVEGFKSDAIPKIEVYRPALGQPPLWPAMDVLAVAADAPVPGCYRPLLDLGAPVVIADFICGTLGLRVKSGSEE